MSHKNKPLDLNTRNLFPTSLLEAQRLIGELIGENARLKDLAYTDELTHLVNRRPLMAQMDRVFHGRNGAEERRRARRGTESIAVMAIDLEGFKQVNDRSSHAEGDRALIHTAQVLRRAIREDDIAARVGGDEFHVSLYNTTLEGANLAIERILKGVRSFESLVGKHVLDVRIGCVFWEREMGDAQYAKLFAIAEHNERTLKTEKRVGSLVTLFKP